MPSIAASMALCDEAAARHRFRDALHHPADQRQVSNERRLTGQRFTRPITPDRARRPWMRVVLPAILVVLLLPAALVLRRFVKPARPVAATLEAPSAHAQTTRTAAPATPSAALTAASRPASAPPPPVSAASPSAKATASVSAATPSAKAAANVRKTLPPTTIAPQRPVAPRPSSPKPIIIN